MIADDAAIGQREGTDIEGGSRIAEDRVVVGDIKIGQRLNNGIAVEVDLIHTHGLIVADRHGAVIDFKNVVVGGLCRSHRERTVSTHVNCRPCSDGTSDHVITDPVQIDGTVQGYIRQDGQHAAGIVGPILTASYSERDIARGIAYGDSPRISRHDDTPVVETHRAQGGRTRENGSRAGVAEDQSVDIDITSEGYHIRNVLISRCIENSHITGAIYSVKGKRPEWSVGVGAPGRPLPRVGSTFVIDIRRLRTRRRSNRKEG